MAKPLNRLALCIAILGMLAAFVLLGLPPPQRLYLAREGGPVETLSALTLGLGLVAGVLGWYRSPSLIRASMVIIFLWMYMREQDYQRLFTPRSIESTGFYLRPEYPLKMKLLALAAMAPVVAALLHLGFRAIQRLRRKDLPRPSWWFPVLMALACLGTGIITEKFLGDPAEITEEVHELAFASILTLTMMRLGLGTGSRQNTSTGSAPTKPEVRAEAGPPPVSEG